MDTTSYTTIVTIAFIIFHDAAHTNIDVLIVVFFGTISTLKRNDFIVQSLNLSFYFRAAIKLFETLMSFLPNTIYSSKDWTAT